MDENQSYVVVSTDVSDPKQEERHAWKKKELNKLADRETMVVPSNGANREQRRKAYK